MIGVNITADDQADSILLLTSYNAGEFTVAQAYKNAVNAGDRNPSQDFTDLPYLKKAIETVVEKFKLTWDVNVKYTEMSEYAGRVLTFLDIFRGNTTITKPNVAAGNTTSTTIIVHSNTNINTQYYTVIAGDTGYKIAEKLKTAFTELSKVNPNVNWAKLSLGQQINIPGKTNITKPIETEPVKPKTAISYSVLKGETPNVIATKFKISIAQLKASNLTVWKRWPNGSEGFDAGTLITIPV